MNRNVDNSSRHFGEVQLEQLYSSSYTAEILKKFRFILSVGKYISVKKRNIPGVIVWET